MEELSEMGAIVHTCSRNEAELHQRLQEWNAKGFKVSGSVCDASSRDQRTELIEKVSSIFNGKLNILVSTPYKIFLVKNAVNAKVKAMFYFGHPTFFVLELLHPHELWEILTLG